MKNKNKKPRVIAIVNQKGGVGKTTTTINLGVGLSKLKRKVLLLDIDPQSSLTYSMGIDADLLDKTIYEVLKGEADVKESIVSKNGVDIIPSSIALSGAEIELSGIAGRESILKEAISSVINNYDYVLLDCPPSLGLLTLNVLTTASEVFIPLQTEFLALQGMSQLLQTISLVKKRLNDKLEITGIIATCFDYRKNLNKEVIDRIKEHFEGKLFKTKIRNNISLAEAPSHGQDIFSYKAESNGAIDYLSLSHEVIKQEE